jgi:hypothetical protein
MRTNCESCCFVVILNPSQAAVADEIQYHV